MHSGNDSMNFPCTGASQAIYILCYVWRPGTGKHATILEGNSNANFSEPTTNSKRSIQGTFSGAAVASMQNGDRIVFEVWFRLQHATTTSSFIYWYFDGNTETTVTNTLLTGIEHASFIETPENLVWAPITMTPVSTKAIKTKFITA
jgi:hypothetical protein